MKYVTRQVRTVGSKKSEVLGSDENTSFLITIWHLSTRHPRRWGLGQTACRRSTCPCTSKITCRRFLKALPGSRCSGQPERLIKHFKRLCGDFNCFLSPGFATGRFFSAVDNIDISLSLSGILTYTLLYFKPCLYLRTCPGHSEKTSP